MINYTPLDENSLLFIDFINPDKKKGLMEYFKVSEFNEIRDIFCDCVMTASQTHAYKYPVRKAYLFTAITLYNTFDALREEFFYDEKACNYSDKFCRREWVAPELPRFEDGINYDAPEEEGLYLIGEVNANPYTEELFYWIKPGYSKNIAERMKQYNTCCPMLWRADFKTDCDNPKQEEKYYHKMMNKIGIAKCNHNEEWFLVDKKTYLKICSKGFSYFD